jgi:hypothetical protein
MKRFNMEGPMKLHKKWKRKPGIEKKKIKVETQEQNGKYSVKRKKFG